MRPRAGGARSTPAAARRPGAAAALLAVGVIVWPCLAGAATYKWVDEQGVVHYSDKMPPEAVNRGSQQLSKEGVPLRRIDPAPTAEQRRAREAEEERRRALAKQQEEAERRDRALLASYTSEREIELSRQRALATIDAVLESATHYSDQLQRRKIDVEAQRARHRDKPMPVVLEREYEGINLELAKQTELIRQKRAERDATAARYAAERMRWRELSGVDKPASPAPTPATPPAGSPTVPMAPASAKPATPAR